MFKSKQKSLPFLTHVYIIVTLDFEMYDTWNLSKNTYNAIGVYTYLTL
ncbi:hypothetical protein ALT721_1090056 [Alteromonas alvinellae]